MNRTIYLSGPMSSKEDFNEPAFAEAELWLLAQGFQKVINPFHLHKKGVIKPWTEYMRTDIAVLTTCDEVRLISDDWQESDGAKLEVYVARRLGIPVCDIDGNKLPICASPLAFFDNPWLAMAGTQPAQ